MSSFFTTPASQKKRKRAERTSASASKRRNLAKPNSRPKSPTADDESISGSESSENDGARTKNFSESEEDDSLDEAETAAERRLKLAERYLENVRAEVAGNEDHADGGFDAADLDREIISARLKEDIAEDKGKIYRSIASTLDCVAADRVNFRADTQAVNGVAVCGDLAYVVTADRTLSKWRLAAPSYAQRRQETESNGENPKRHNPFGQRRPKQLKFTRGDRRRFEDKLYNHHASPILCVAASADGRFVVTGGAGHRYWNTRIEKWAFTGRMIVWDAETLEQIKVFNDHRDAVTSVAFRGRTNQLFSGSKDRTLKVYSLNELAYVETLFGHQDEVVDVAAVGGSQERCLSVGARDRSARLWKVVEESQLIFRGGGSGFSKKKILTDQDDVEDAQRPQTHEGSLDRVAQLDTQFFVTGADNGSLALYALHKKKPLHVYPQAHGYDPPISVKESLAEADVSGRKTQAKATARGITALACVPFSDLFASGSWEGCVRLWRLNMDTKKIEPVAILGRPEQPRDILAEAYGEDDEGEQGLNARIRGVINDLAIGERGDRGKDGLYIVVGHGKDMRFGGWRKFKKGKNGCVVFEIPSHKTQRLTNGDHDHDGENGGL